VAGFRQSFGSGRICRFCMACKDEIRVKFSEEEFTVRTQSIHDYHAREVTRNTSNAAIHGVCGHCTFSDLNYFSVTQCFPADIMHDCLEGVIPFVLRLVLAKLRENDSNMYNDINKVIASAAPETFSSTTGVSILASFTGTLPALSSECLTADEFINSKVQHLKNGYRNITGTVQ